MIRNPRDVLGVREGASMEEIKRAYRQKAKACHPDLHPDDPRANEKMQEINQAYDMLCNPAKYSGWRQPEAGAYGWQGSRAGHGDPSQDGGRQYTYYTYSSSRDAWRDFGEGDRRTTSVSSPFRGAIRIIGGIMLFRAFMAFLRLLFFGFFW